MVEAGLPVKMGRVSDHRYVKTVKNTVIPTEWGDHIAKILERQTQGATSSNTSTSKTSSDKKRLHTGEGWKTMQKPKYKLKPAAGEHDLL